MPRATCLNLRVPVAQARRSDGSGRTAPRWTSRAGAGPTRTGRPRRRSSTPFDATPGCWTARCPAAAGATSRCSLRPPGIRWGEVCSGEYDQTVFRVLHGNRTERSVQPTDHAHTHLFFPLSTLPVRRAWVGLFQHTASRPMGPRIQAHHDLLTRIQVDVTKFL